MHNNFTDVWKEIGVNEISLFFVGQFDLKNLIEENFFFKLTIKRLVLEIHIYHHCKTAWKIRSLFYDFTCYTFKFLKHLIIVVWQFVTQKIFKWDVYLSFLKAKDVYILVISHQLLHAHKCSFWIIIIHLFEIDVLRQDIKGSSIDQ